DGDASRAAAARGTDGASEPRQPAGFAKLPEPAVVCRWRIGRRSGAGDWSGAVAGVTRQVHPHGGGRRGRSRASHAGSGSVGGGDWGGERQRPFLEPEKAAGGEKGNRQGLGEYALGEDHVQRV